jgi:peptidoglycan/LPS O-acetylase OafA/YrhL
MNLNIVQNTQTDNRLPLLDGWRGTAILLVLIGHFGAHNLIVNLGRLGVELFFVLSGRLMAELLFVRRTPIKDFLRRRITRVWPTTLVLCGVMWSIFSDTISPLYVSPMACLSGVTFTLNYYLLWAPDTEVLDHLWSLAIEEHIYLLLGLIALGARICALHVKSVLGLLIVTAVIIGGVQTWQYGWNYNDVYWRTDVRGASILMGSLAYLLVQNGWGKKWSSHSVLALGVIGLILNLRMIPDPIKYSAGSACIAATLAQVDRLPSWITAVLKHPALRFAGLMSFSLYLWQQPFYKLLNTWGWWDRFPLLLAAALTGAASFYLVEQPSRRWLNRVWATSTLRVDPTRAH